ncbi:hypothetical protein Dsin_017150 [Dipteronia sinensis]|uniref:Reverse transcriptase zinc-binding domain-containing protein n=1 Tax=Dipteronia sinensis TaxID=43782 RepID=A0AAE0AES9_9ROSI|nr:hypothetical protein Dsin_017150 [Dipteronia sinensis]
MEVEIKPTGLFIWKSLGWGREIIAAGSRWRVGNGSKIRIYKDRWIPRPTTFRPLSPPIGDENALVSHLITPSGGWNIEKIRNNFSVEDVEAVLSIPLSRSSWKDSIIWHYDQKGIYTVKNGYWVGRSQNSDPESSGEGGVASIINAFWKGLWKIPIPGKIKLFMWRACNDFLPTNLCLAKQKIPIDLKCPLCKCKDETILHTL